MDRVAQLLASEDLWRGALRTVGGLLLGAGLVLVFLRRLAFDPWGDLALLLVLIAAVALLYGTGMLAFRATGRSEPWQAALMIFGVLVVPVALFQFLSWIDADTGAPLNVAWIFLATAAVAASTAAAGIRYGLFLASLALIVAWLSLWHELLAGGIFGEIGALRALLVAIGIALAAAAVAARLFSGSDRPARGNELLVGAGVALIGAGAISFHAYLGRSALIPDLAVAPTLFWDAYLLAVSVGAVVVAVTLGVRGLAYAGAIGIAVFVFVVGFDLGNPDPTGSLLGWPLVAVVVGAAAFAASLIRVVEEPGGEPPTDPRARVPGPGEAEPASALEPDPGAEGDGPEIGIGEDRPDRAG